MAEPGEPPAEAPPPYVPTLAPAEIERIRRWHEAAYEEIRRSLPAHASLLGIDVHVPQDVFPPAPLTAFRDAIVAEVRPGDRVLDMGTGSGVNALLAARVAREVVGVDVNACAVAAAADNAERNGLSDRTNFVQGDLFAAVDGRFDLVLFDPPFRWFTPRDLLEAAMTDEGYRTLARFMTGLRGVLNPGGRALVFTGTSADVGHLHRLVDAAGLSREVVGEARAARGEHVVDYAVLRLVPLAASGG